MSFNREDPSTWSLHEHEAAMRAFNTADADCPKDVLKIRMAAAAERYHRMPTGIGGRVWRQDTEQGGLAVHEYEINGKQEFRFSIASENQLSWVGRAAISAEEALDLGRVLSARAAGMRFPR